MPFSKEILELNEILNKASSYSNTKSSFNRILNLEPVFKLETVVFNIGFTDELTRIIERFGKLPFIEGFDCTEVIVRLKYATLLTIDDFLLLRRFLSMEKGFQSFLKQLNSSFSFVYPYLTALPNHEQTLKQITKVISDDGEVYSDASVKLQEIRRNLKHKEKILERLLTDVLVKYASYLNEALIVTRQGRFCIPVKESYKNKVKGVVHDISASKQTVYIEPEDIRQTTSDIEYLHQLEADEIQRILTELTNQIRVDQDTLLHHAEQFIELDVIHAKALYGLSIAAIKPNINDDGEINLKHARHPLIPKDSVVPIDVILNSKQKVLMITGPNTGGKTVALKTVGLLTLMLQCGLLIPVRENSSMSVFKDIFADIGDEQSIEQSLSTFSSHLTKIKTMFDQLSNKALVLLDELGSGTDPNEGVALAIAIIDELRKKDCRIILTTHYSELKMYAFEHDDILSASVAFDENTLKPLYKLQLGVAGSSHAIAIANRLGLRSNVIEHARFLLQGRQSNLAKMLEKLSTEQNELANLKEQTLFERQQLTKERSVYEQKNLTFEKEKTTILEKIKEKEYAKIEKIKQELFELMADLANKKTLSKPEIASIKHKLKNEDAAHLSLSDEELKIGDHVYIKSYQQEGVIIDSKRDSWIVSFGQFELEFPNHDLVKSEAPKAKKQSTSKIKISGKTVAKEGSMELDLRGFKYEDVKPAIDKAIDSAILSNLPSIRIIHGFGTGAVRNAVQAYIKQSPYIKSHRYGGAGEGLNGVTIISL